jgi:hypothetical protein
MQEAASNAAVIRQMTGARVLLVHHTGKNRKRGARGGSSLTAAADTVISLDEEKDHHVMRCVRQRDGERFAPVFLKLTKTADGAAVLFERCEAPGVSLLDDKTRERARLQEQILAVLRQQPGLKESAVVTKVHRKKADVLEALAGLRMARRADFERSGFGRAGLAEDAERNCGAASNDFGSRIWFLVPVPYRVGTGEPNWRTVLVPEPIGTNWNREPNCCERARAGCAARWRYYEVVPTPQPRLPRPVLVRSGGRTHPRSFGSR